VSTATLPATATRLAGHSRRRPSPAPSATSSVGASPRRASRVPAATIWRRRAVAVLALVLVAFLLTVAIGRVGAGAELDDRVAGHVVVAPGETLWDVAAVTAPPGVDVREQVAALEALNGFAGGDVPAWTVVLIPAR
jgi:hypothetical protein